MHITSRFLALRLPIAVFTCGAAVMVLELAAARVVAPYIGTSHTAWTSLIGVIMGSLALGYWLGGKIADRHPERGALATIIVGAGLLVLLAAAFNESYLSLFDFGAYDLRWASVVAVTPLFAPASILLGMVSPYAVKLHLRDLETSASRVGSLSALSTLGSIAGTFLAGFVLMAYFGNQRILLGTGLLLIVLGLFLGFTARRAQSAGAAIVAALLVATGLWPATPYLVDADTAYARVRVFDGTDLSGRLVRTMLLGNEHSSAVYLDSDELAYEYTRFYDLAETFVPSIDSALMLGGAGYSYPKYFLGKYPESRMDVVEIDPGVTAVARSHFGLVDDPRLNIFHADARMFLNSAPSGSYDVIYGDAFRSTYSVPYQLTTVEALREAARILKPGGALLINVIGSVEGESGAFFRAELRTLREVFPQVHLFPVSVPGDGLAVQNIMVVASTSEVPVNLAEVSAPLASYVANRWDREVAAIEPVLTDDFAPVDRYTGAVITAWYEQTN